MKAIILLSFFATCLCINTSAQGIDSKIDSFIKINYIDSFLVYSFTCNELWHDIDSCNQQTPLYLIWKKNGYFSIQKFERCKDYKPVKIDNKNPLNFYFSYREAIDKEEIKPPVYYEYKKERHQKYSIEVTSVQSHSCFYNLNLRTTTTFTKKSVDSYNLEFTEFDDGKKNVNSSYNNNTKLKQLILNMKTLVNLTSFTKIN